MSRGGLGHDEVKSICDKLECSPSQHSKPHPMQPPNIHVSGQTAASGSTSEFQKTRRSGKVTGYSGRYAKGARQE